MFNSNLNNDSDSIDLDFFEKEENQIKKYSKSSKSNCSKIVTKAIIEMDSRYADNPEPLVVLSKNNLKQKRKSCCTSKWNISPNSKSSSSDSSPSSSFDRKEIRGSSSKESCEVYNSMTYTNQDSGLSLLEDTDLSDNSVSDSSITTVTSDFTSISPFSTISDSSLESGESLDSPTSKIQFTPRPDDGKSKYEDSYYSHGKDESDVVIYEEIKHDNTVGVGQKYLNSNIKYTGLGLDNDTTNAHNYEMGLSCENDEFKSDHDCKPLKNDNKINFVKGFHSIHLEGDSKTLKLSPQESNTSTLEEDLKYLTVSPQPSSSSFSRSPSGKEINKIHMKRRKCNLTFNREQLIKIERDNLILLKKIMNHSKPKAISLNQTFGLKKTSAAINRAKHQKKIDQDNFILYSKINAMGRAKKVC